VQTLDVGEVTTLVAVFTNEDGTLTSPASVTLTITSPSSAVTTVVTAGLQNPSTGRYEYDLLVTATGVWTYRFAGSGNGVSAGETRYILAGRTPGLGLCAPWIEPEDLFATGTASLIPAADRRWGEAARCVMAASEYLYERSGRRFSGICERTVRPCSQTRDSGIWWDTPVYLDTLWTGYHCECSAAGPASCACGGYDEIDLPGEPIVGIKQVMVDGDMLASTAYRLDSFRHLVRIDDALWPTCQDLGAPTTETNTFAVTYWYGREVPELGRLAARELSSEMYLSLIGSPECRLPRQVSSLSRQGVTMAFVSQPEYGPDGQTGLATVDTFLGAYGGRRRATVASPDLSPRARTTG
jgi:hypothetical protein